MEHVWGAEHALAYLEEAYRPEWANLHAWIEARLGIPLPLAELVGDPRSTSRTGLQKLQWPVHEALASLLRHPGDRERGRIEAAADLLTAGESDKAVAVLNLLVDADPSRADIRALLADALQSAGREAEALALAEDILQAAPLEQRAIDVALRGLAWARRWKDLLALAIRALEGPTVRRPRPRGGSTSIYPLPIGNRRTRWCASSTLMMAPVSSASAFVAMTWASRAMT